MPTRQYPHTYADVLLCRCVTRAAEGAGHGAERADALREPLRRPADVARLAEDRAG
jgi:hypothetical protein